MKIDGDQLLFGLPDDFLGFQLGSHKAFTR
jgi:hypothetical protein